MQQRGRGAVALSVIAVLAILTLPGSIEAARGEEHRHSRKQKHTRAKPGRRMDRGDRRTLAKQLNQAAAYFRNNRPDNQREPLMAGRDPLEERGHRRQGLQKVLDHVKAEIQRYQRFLAQWSQYASARPLLNTQLKRDKQALEADQQLAQELLGYNIARLQYETAVVGDGLQYYQLVDQLGSAWVAAVDDFSPRALAQLDLVADFAGRIHDLRPASSQLLQRVAQRAERLHSAVESLIDELPQEFGWRMCGELQGRQILADTPVQRRVVIDVDRKIPLTKLGLGQIDDLRAWLAFVSLDLGSPLAEARDWCAQLCETIGKAPAGTAVSDLKLVPPFEHCVITVAADATDPNGRATGAGGPNGVSTGTRKRTYRNQPLTQWTERLIVQCKQALVAELELNPAEAAKLWEEFTKRAAFYRELIPDDEMAHLLGEFDFQADFRHEPTNGAIGRLASAFAEDSGFAHTLQDLAEVLNYLLGDALGKAYGKSLSFGLHRSQGEEKNETLYVEPRLWPEQVSILEYRPTIQGKRLWSLLSTLIPVGEEQLIIYPVFSRAIVEIAAQSRTERQPWAQWALKAYREGIPFCDMSVAAGRVEDVIAQANGMRSQMCNEPPDYFRPFAAALGNTHFAADASNEKLIVVDAP